MKKIAVDGWTINDILELYINKKLFVDQKYQRKLVWSLEDKKLFIDSLIKKFPIPNIMMVEYSDGNDEYGIIDGLQRINAIISFMLNEFPITIDGEEKYFDLSTTPGTFDMRQNGKLDQKSPILEKKVCIEFRGYKLPIISTSHDTKTIDEIFKRLNSTGTKLSRHDLRQAGSTNIFSRLVREISSIVRGGKTAVDIVSVDTMPKISLSNNGLDYGIDINTVFWRKHGILTEDLLRKSRDEEIIATLLGAFLLERQISVIRANVLDDLYIENTADGQMANNKLEKCHENVKTLFVEVFNELEMIYEDTGYSVSDFLFETDRRKTDIFMIFFMYMLQNHFEFKAIGNYKDFVNAIRNIKKDISNKIEERNLADYISEKNTMKLIADVCSSYLVDTESLSKLTNEVISRLNLAATETKYTEYKMGFTYFNCQLRYKHNEGKINFKNVSQIAKVASAMANSSRDIKNTSMIIVGIADNESDYKDWSEYYGLNAYKYNNHRVVGIDEEAKRHYKNIDNMMLKFINRLDGEPISDELKSDLKQFDIVTIQKRSLVVFSINASPGQLYGGKKYIREGNSLKVLE